MNIDIHAHFVDRHYLDELTRQCKLDIEQTPDGKTLLRDKGATIAWTRPDMFDIEHRLRDMDNKGIGMRVLSVSAPNVYPFAGDEQMRMTRHVNDRLAEYCRAHPDRFIGLASLPLNDIGASLKEIDRAVGDLGLKGLALGSNIGGPPLNDPALRAAVEAHQRAAPAGGRASDVSQGHVGHGRVRAAAARRADVRHHADGGAHDLRRHLRTLSRTFHSCWRTAARR